MLKTIIIPLILSSSLLFPMSIEQVKEGSTKELGCIKGVGQKRLSNIINYEKENTLKSMDDLLNVKGIGKGILKNIKEDIQKKSCLRDKKNPLPKKSSRSKKKIDAE